MAKRTSAKLVSKQRSIALHKEERSRSYPRDVDDPSYIPSTEQEFIDCVDWHIRELSHEASIELIRACGSSSTKGIDQAGALYQLAEIHIKQLCELLKEPKPSSASPWRAAYHAYWMGRAIQGAGIVAFQAYAIEDRTANARHVRQSKAETTGDKMRAAAKQLHKQGMPITKAKRKLAKEFNVGETSAYNAVRSIWG